MQTTKIIKSNLINDNEIDMHHVLVSILNIGMKKKVLSMSEVEEKQRQLMKLLGEQIMKFTNNQSSSVKTDTAQRIMNSLVYAIDIRLMQDFDADSAVEILKRNSIEILYKEGMDIIDEMLKNGLDLMQQVKESRLDIDLICYHESIDNISQSFFGESEDGMKSGSRNSGYGYDAAFDAHDTVASIDYPLLCDDMDWDGITYINSYLLKLKIENEFCSKFDLNDIKHLLNRTARKTGIPHAELLVNISEIVLLNSLCAVMLGKNADMLIINEIEARLLLVSLKDKSLSELRAILCSSFELIKNEIVELDGEAEAYFNEFIQKACIRFKNAIEQEALNGLIVVEDDRTAIKSKQLHYQAGQKLEDQQFRVIIQEVLQCSDGRQKARILKEELNNIEDLIDVFNAFCIFDNEYEELFNEFDSMTLALIVSKLVDKSPELLQWLNKRKEKQSDILIKQSGTHKLSSFEFDSMSNTENEIYWNKRLVKYLENCEDERFQAVLTQAQALINQYI